MKLSMARASSQSACITNKTHGKTELNVNRLTVTLLSNLGARLQQATASYNCNQGHEWIDNNLLFKRPLLKYLKICMDLFVATCLHGIKITAEQELKSAISQSLVCMLVLVTTLITKIHGKHLCKEDMAQIKTHVDINLIGCTHQSWQK